MIHAIEYWLYPINAESDYWLEDPDSGQKTVVSRENLRRAVERDPNRTDSWVLSTGYRSLRPGDAVWIYAADPDQAICAVGRALQVYEDFHQGSWYVDLLWDLETTRQLMATSIPRSLFGQIPQRCVVRADDTTTAVLSAWLRKRGIVLTGPDDPDGPGSDGDARSRVLAEIVRRQGQRAFREQLLKEYERRCAVTNESAEAVLEAAHINPYMGSHTNTLSNGLLLRADLHTLFDLHLVGIDTDRCLVVSSQLAGTSYARLAGAPLRPPRSAAARPSRQRLARHLKELRS